MCGSMPGISQQVWCILCISSSPGKPNTLAKTWILGSSPGHPLATMVVSVLKTQWYLFILNTLIDMVFLCQWMRILWQMIWMDLGSSRKTLHTPIFLSFFLCLSLSPFVFLCELENVSVLQKGQTGHICSNCELEHSVVSKTVAWPSLVSLPWLHHMGLLIIVSYACTFLPSGH